MKGNYELDGTSTSTKFSRRAAHGQRFTLVQATNRTRSAPDRARRLLQLTLEIVGIVALFLIVVGFVLNTLPTLSVESSMASNPNDPTSTVFSLSNDGRLPVYDVSLACALNNLGEIVDRVVINLGRQSAAVLRPGDRLALSCPDAVRVNTVYPQPKAMVTLLLTYRPAWVPWNKRASFTMAAENTAPGVWTWRGLP